jgi:peptidyl-prolyl cis-trans isomerase C
MRMIREPLFHFMLIGALIYGAYARSGFEAEPETQRSIVVTAGEVQWLLDSWQNRWNRPPTREEFNRYLNSYIREQVLASEAQAMGLDEGDMVIRRRLAQRLETFTKDLLTPGSTDPQVLRKWFETHKEKYREPVRYTLAHIYLDPANHGDQVVTEAESLRDTLNSLDALPADLDAYGDPFMLQNYYPEYSAAELAREFGSRFADAIEQLEPGQWQAPILSGYGVHVVFVRERLLPEEPVFADVETEVREDWIAVTTAELYEQFESGLVERYDVQVDGSITPQFITERTPAGPPGTEISTGNAMESSQEAGNP